MDTSTVLLFRLRATRGGWPVCGWPHRKRRVIVGRTGVTNTTIRPRRCERQMTSH